MSVVVTLLGYSPPARADGVAFTKAKVEESPTGKGEWTARQTITLSPVDADPEHPESRDLTITTATIPSGGWYRVVWIDSAANESAPTAPALDASELAGGVRPTVTDVANLLRARTQVRGGNESGTFNARTRPTADEVDGMIDEALDEVLGKVRTVKEVEALGVDKLESEAYERRVRGAVKLYTAVLIETSYFPEQIKAGQSAHDVYLHLYESRIKALIAEGETGEVQGEGDGSGSDSSGHAFYSFPDDNAAQIGLGTRF